MRYYLGPWQWSAGPAAWSAPPGTVGLVDLGSLTDLGAASGSPRRVGFFCLPDAAPLDSAYADLGRGDCREIAVTPALQSAWRAATGYRPQGATLLDLLWGHLTAGSDPDGLAACLPLVPGTDGWMDLYLGGHSRVRGERFEWGRPGSRGTDHTPKLRALLRAQFRGHFARDPDHARRVLDAWCERYRVDKSADWREFVPPDLQPHLPGPLPHATTITESFNKADSTTLGPDLAWTEVSGDWQVISNAAGKASVNGQADLARANAALSSADHYAQIVRKGTGSGDYQGPAARVDGSGALTYYTTLCDGTLYLQKDVAGSATNFATTSQAVNDGDTYKVECNGSTIKSYVNGTQKLSATDTSIAGNTNAGMTLYHATDSVIDDFEAADLGGGGGGVLYTQLERSTRGLVRGVFGGSTGG